MYPNCTATTSHASGIQSGDRQIISLPPDRVIQGARVIDEPRITGKLGDSNYESEHEKSREQCISLCEYKTEEQTIIDKIERRPGAPIRPRREREQ